MEQILEKISSLYGLNLRFVEKVAHGFLSENSILAHDGEKYFLKKFGVKKADRLKEIHAAEKYFSEGGIPVITALATQTQETFFEHNRNLYALFPFFEGHHLKERQVTARAVTSLAETLAHMHLLGRNATVPVRDTFRPWRTESVLNEINLILEKVSAISAPTEFDIRAQQNVLLKKRIIESDARTYDQFNLANDHLIHGDYMIGNVFFDDTDTVAGVFDFDKTCYAPRVFELFRSMIYATFWTEPIDAAALAQAKLYLDSYLAIYPMPLSDLNDAFFAYRVRCAHSTWVESEHYLNDNSRGDELLETDALRMAYLANNFDDLKRYLFA